MNSRHALESPSAVFEDTRKMVTPFDSWGSAIDTIRRAGAGQLSLASARLFLRQN
jgi:hypothetical protein